MQPFFRHFYLFFFSLFLIAGCGKTQAQPEFREGDILFQVTTSPQSEAIQLGTGSPYTHCGVIMKKEGRLQVFEAHMTVRFTPLEAWIRNGVNGHYVLMRLKDSSILTPSAIAKLHQESRAFLGKPYDIRFQWSDAKIYCSELVWKLYQRSIGIELGKIRTFSEYDLDHDAVRKIIRQRYGRSFDLNEKVVAPSDVMESPLLEVIYKNAG